MSEELFSNLLKSEPFLTYNGFEDSISREEFTKNRKALEESFDEFLTCCEWIKKHQTKIKRRDLKDYNFLKHHYNSYFLTHSVEKWSGKHISNGAFIAALIYFEVSYKPILGSPDISVFLALNKETPYL
jgi:hypothetical protein